MKPPLFAFPTLETSRLTITPLSVADAEAVVAVTNDPAITEVVHFLQSPFTPRDADVLISRNDAENCFLAVFHHSELIGIVGVHTQAEKRLEIGYWVGTKFQRKGFASEAAFGVISQLRAMYPDRQLVAECRLGNEASWTLLNKLGFRAAGKGDRPGRELLILS